jgi:signal transduction histidine kinase
MEHTNGAAGSSPGAPTAPEIGAPGPDPPRRPALNPRLVDALLALGITLAVGVVAAAEVPDAGPVRPTAYLFAVGFGALMFLRRRAPCTVLVLTVLGVFGYYALGYRPIGIALPAVAALYSAADMDRTRWAIGSGVVLLGVSAFFRIRQEDLSAAYLFSYDLVTNVALIAAAIALGITVRMRRDAHRQQQRLGDLMAAESAMRAAERLQAERMRIARDLHDALGHSLSVVAVQSNVAAEALDRHDDGSAARAVEAIRSTASATIRELRTTVRVLRSPVPADEPTRSVLGLAGLDRLAQTARDAGIQVTTAVDSGQVLPAAIDSAAYRIVQEALTNVIRHSGARAATVTARVHGGRLDLEIADDGRGIEADGSVGDPARPAVTAAGHGVLGMRERATLLGGRLTATNGAHGGFVVCAELPAHLGR